MRHRLFTTSLVAGIGLGLTVATAGSAAADPRAGECPAGLERATVEFVQTQVEPGFEGAVAAADANGNNNGFVCYRLNPGRPVVLFGDDSAGFGSGKPRH
jgi:hypothetical protein